MFRRNHPTEWPSTHPFFFNSMLGIVERDTVEFKPLWIGHHTWIGENALITPGCQRVGIGAVVGAGSVVTKDVPDFAIVAGSPAREIRRRFGPALAAEILASKWWDLPIEVVRQDIGAFTRSMRSREDLRASLSL